MEKKQQFLPTLIDRLTDEDPKCMNEPFDKFFFNSREMRKLVHRDIIAILNHSNIEYKLDEKRTPEVGGSVLNYGFSPMIGSHADARDWLKIERSIRNAIFRFEPRVIPEALVIKPMTSKNSPFQHGMVSFEIRGLIFWQPHPIDICFKGTYDIEIERMSLSM